MLTSQFDEQAKKTFVIDPRILSTCFELGEWPLCTVLLKNNAEYPWLILVPRLAQIQEIDEVPQELRHQLINEIAKLSSIVRAYFKPDKVNVAYLGNIVSQFHVHVVARFKQDKLWPHGIWQASQDNTPYNDSILFSLIKDLKARTNS